MYLLLAVPDSRTGTRRAIRFAVGAAGPPEAGLQGLCCGIATRYLTAGRSRLSIRAWLLACFFQARQELRPGSSASVQSLRAGAGRGSTNCCLRGLGIGGTR